MASPTTKTKAPLPFRNEVLMNRGYLLSALDDLAKHLYAAFGATVRLVVHGGAVMVLHPLLACRESTRDVDYLHRAFEREWLARGFTDAGARLRSCIRATARVFNLGADWMNACADVALPMASDPASGWPYDPVHTAALDPRNVKENTIFASPGLVLVGVSWPWAIAFKLARYQKHDPYDIAYMLRLGSRDGRVDWTRQVLEWWILTKCGPMGSILCAPTVWSITRDKIRHAIHLAFPHKYPLHAGWI
ncbi:hypothetical protein BN946_scf184943.g73 [Trametes cinnabarina]|uniref:Uncharacterized protein n=1 Tax=Pycnoporus cinnabarinus TaxID=5643 RepID=A0A060SHX2_PYCCI|nr:hypothetical protein BN946_scf184943.g73 [Trametes cinnabarina]